MKIRNGFVSNSSSSAFILKKDIKVYSKIKELHMAFENVKIVDDDIIVRYTGGSDLVKKILNGLNLPEPTKWINVI